VILRSWARQASPRRPEAVSIGSTNVLIGEQLSTSLSAPLFPALDVSREFSCALTAHREVVHETKYGDTRRER
jgi:hypothetical protein